MRSERRAARIAVDLLGGDNAPDVVVDGALLALNTDARLRLLPVGPLEVVDRLLAQAPAELRSRIDPVPVAADGVAPVRAAARLLATGQADAMVSAGSTAATVTAAVAGYGRYPGLARPALAVLIPALRGPLILLDVGASPNATPADLRRHAVLGAGYALAMLGVDAPRIGLLSIGTEPGSGDALRRTADELLTRCTLPVGARYVGRVEGHDVTLGGAADVVVTDGFTGNVLLKGIEGALRLQGRSGLPAMDEAGTPHAAVLLGVLGPVVVCHGAASGPDLASGVALACRLAEERVPEQVARVDEAFRGDQTPAPGGVPT
ncbi:MAG: phosphate acyltransferase PlsX [Actinocatenispora sp.]